MGDHQAPSSCPNAQNQSTEREELGLPPSRAAFPSLCVDTVCPRAPGTEEGWV